MREDVKNRFYQSSQYAPSIAVPAIPRAFGKITGSVSPPGPAGRGYQQCRIWQSLVRRRYAYVGFPRTDRNESLRDNHRDDGSSPVRPRKKGGPFHSVFPMGGRIGLPGRGPYSAAKWGVEGFSEVLSHEVEPLGIKVTISSRVASAHGLRRQFHHAERRASRIRFDYWSNGQVSA
jgi:NAD(P)-dependent dehydrogenase (short-subunit alcohol dehydrogenase family)